MAVSCERALDAVAGDLFDLEGLDDLSQSDPNREHRLTGGEVVLVQRAILPVPLGQELVPARLRLARPRPDSIALAPDRAL